MIKNKSGAGLRSGERFFLIAVIVLGTACSKKQDELLEIAAKNPMTAVEKSTLPPETAKKEEPIRYYYPFAQYRDPFQALLSPGGASGGTRTAQDPQIIVQNFTSLELKGIFKDKDGKIALISSKQGESFTLKSGRVYDKRNHKIQTVTGIIKENSIVLFGPNKVVKELYLKKG